MGILWTIVIGFVAGIIAKFLHPGPNEPTGFILTTILGIVGAFVATFLGQALGWYRADEGAGLIGAVIGAVVVLFLWSMLARRNTTSVYLIKPTSTAVQVQHLQELTEPWISLHDRPFGTSRYGRISEPGQDR